MQRESIQSASHPPKEEEKHSSAENKTKDTRNQQQKTQ